MNIIDIYNKKRLKIFLYIFLRMKNISITFDSSNKNTMPSVPYINYAYDPTWDRNLNPKVKSVSFQWELCDVDGCPWACDIYYEIDDRNQVWNYGVRFHYGCGRNGLLGIKEALQEIVEDLEGRCTFLTEPIIE